MPQAACQHRFLSLLHFSGLCSSHTRLCISMNALSSVILLCLYTNSSFFISISSQAPGKLTAPRVLHHLPVVVLTVTSLPASGLSPAALCSLRGIVGRSSASVLLLRPLMQGTPPLPPCTRMPEPLWLLLVCPLLPTFFRSCQLHLFMWNAFLKSFLNLLQHFLCCLCSGSLATRHVGS